MSAHRIRVAPSLFAVVVGAFGQPRFVLRVRRPIVARRHVRALRVAQQALARELAQNPIGRSGWASRLLGEIDETVQLLERQSVQQSTDD